MPARFSDGIESSSQTAPCPLYEQARLRQATGDTLRPGGTELTGRLLAHCALPPQARLLDVGCGRGASLAWLPTAGAYRPYGVDYSIKLLKEAAGRRQTVAHALAGRLPFSEASFDAVMMECSLSIISNQGYSIDLSDDLVNQPALQEARRVLRPQGWLLISDLYARRSEGILALREVPGSNCLRGALNLPDLQDSLRKLGFEISFWEDHSATLRQLNCKVRQTYGSMQSFWDQASEEPLDGFDLAIRISRAKPGYFILLARKVKDIP